jgi:hypothetical protein
MAMMLQKRIQEWVSSDFELQCSTNKHYGTSTALVVLAMLGGRTSSLPVNM